MNAEWIAHIGQGAGIAILASLALLFMVYRELAPTGGLTGRGRMLLTLGVGMGVMSFATKVAALALMVAMPELTLTPLSGLHPVDKLRHAWPAANHGVAAPFKAHYVWAALPAADAQDPERVALGERLFRDKALSLDRTLACASCHDVERGAGVDGRATSEGIGGQVGSRNAPTVWNAAFQARLFWDGRAPSLEEQAKGPPVNPVEMGMHTLEEVAARVAENPDYQAAFARSFGPGPLDMDRVAAAIAAYERTLVAADSPYDRFVAGHRDALSPAQRRGMELFESAGCVTCHYGPNFSAASQFDARAPYRLFPAFANDHTGRHGLERDPGRLPAGQGRGLWRVPSLRNVALTGPYFHNGAVKELEEAVRVMAAAQLGYRIVATPSRAPAATVWSRADGSLHRVARRELDENQVKDIAEFLRALSSDRLAANLGR